MHAKRLTDPAVDIPDLDPLDLIVLSHFHGDHFDQAAERDLDKAIPIVTTREAAEELRQRGFHNVHPLKRWESLDVVKGKRSMSISSMPARHGPGLTALALPDVMGSILDFPASTDRPAQRLYLSGDTLVFEELHEIPKR